jgi:hypothetical protein
VEYATAQEDEILTEDYLRKLEEDFVTAQYFIKPLTGIDDPLTKLVALLLLNETDRVFTIPLVQAVAARAGHQVSHERVLEICNDLVINNVLAWNGGSFRIASEGLHLYAHRMGFLETALAEARHNAGTSRG